MKRLFIAVDLDGRTRAAVAQIAATLRERTPFAAPAGTIRLRVTWVPADRLHLTVEFLGEVESDVEQRTTAVLGEPIPIAPFDLSFDGLGMFPESGPPRVLWLGIGGGLADLKRLHVSLRERLSLAADSRDGFNPHLTLARFRDRARRSDLREIAGVKAFAGPCRIDRVTLYESRLSPSGPAYTALAKAYLRR